jgi:hypothetical protein
MVTCLASPPKVIIDTDFNTIGDDGQVAAMAAQLFADGETRRYLMPLKWSIC